ncbi:MAG: dTDP-4-dehydrorhamnose 3,5-epimerase family protein [Nitrospinota bacterium]|nr:dTDP-4-dehydrorhamnose 3,5-epimerase family protein [Nitrospinota bacterium]
MNKSGIEGLQITPLKQIDDERGSVLHMLRSDSEIYIGFGEIYFSFVKQGVVKAWKRHKVMTQHFAVPVGRIKLVLFDDRNASSTKGNIEIIEIGRPDKYELVKIPPLVWYGFKGIGEGESMIANCTDIPHDPEEVERCDIDTSDISYAW